jgi:hypothetical protein
MKLFSRNCPFVVVVVAVAVAVAVVPHERRPRETWTLSLRTEQPG